MSDEYDELEADIEAVLQELVDAEMIELVTRRGAHFLARPFLHALERGVDLEQWLVEHEEVRELYIDNEELTRRFAGVLARIAGREPPVHVHAELAAAIARDLDDANAWTVYGDWLTEQGDPRGELLALQLAGQHAQADKLLARYRRHFLGELGEDRDPTEHVVVTWRNGFLASADVLLADLDALLALESARFLDELVVRVEALEAVAFDRLPRTLRSFAIEPRYRHPDYKRARELDLAALFARLPRLERVALHGSEVRIVAPPQLRSLEIDALDVHCDEAVFAAHPALETLVLEVQRFPGAALSAMVEQPPPRLATLDLRGTSMDSALRTRVCTLWPFAKIGEAVERYDAVDE